MTIESPSVAVSIDSDDQGWFGRLLGAIACLLLFGPVVVLYLAYDADVGTLPIEVTADTVGIGVILRTTLRRLFRSGSRSVLQTAVGTVTRVSARSMTRRVVRLGVKSLAAFLRRTSPSSDTSSAEESSAPQSNLYAVVAGSAALAMSIAGVLLLLDVERLPGSADPPQLSGVLRTMPFAAAVALGAAPLPIYCLLLTLASPWCGARVRFRTGWEAVALQAYFTGSGSYLPLTTDVEIEGAPHARARMAAISLGGLFILHLLCMALGGSLDCYPLEYLGGMFLLFCFVFSFPLPPLDGYHLWARSRVAWLLIFIPILASFIRALPESLHALI